MQADGVVPSNSETILLSKIGSGHSARANNREFFVGITAEGSFKEDSGMALQTFTGSSSKAGGTHIRESTKVMVQKCNWWPMKVGRWGRSVTS